MKKTICGKKFNWREIAKSGYLRRIQCTEMLNCEQNFQSWFFTFFKNIVNFHYYSSTVGCFDCFRISCLAFPHSTTFWNIILFVFVINKNGISVKNPFLAKFVLFMAHFGDKKVINNPSFCESPLTFGNLSQIEQNKESFRRKAIFQLFFIRPN